MQQSTDIQYDDKFFRLAVVIGLVAVVLGVFFNLDPSNDVANLYARQVRLISQGEVDRGLFLFPPPLVVLIASGFAVVGMSAFSALKLVSGLFFVAGLWPLRWITRRVVGVRFVPWTALLYIACPRILRYATMGTTDSAKMFLLLAVMALLFALYDEPRWKTTLLLAVATAGLALTRGETVFFIPPILTGVGWCVWMGIRREQGCARLLCGAGQGVVHGALFAAVVAVLLLPQALRIHRYTGVPALDSRQVMRFGGCDKVDEDNEIDEPGEGGQVGGVSVPAPTHAPVEVLPPTREEDRVTVWRNVRETIKGLHPFMLVFAVVGLGVKLRRRQWSWHDLAFASVIAFNVSLFACNGFITKRYIAPTMPLLLPWTVIGLAALKDNWLDRLAPKAFPILAVLFVLVGVWDGLSDVRPSWDFELEESHVLGAWILEHRDQLPNNNLPPLDWSATATRFHDGAQPVIASCSPQYSFWAQGDWVDIEANLKLPYSYLVDHLTKNRVDLLVVDDAFLRSCPDFFQRQQEHFTELHGLPQGIRPRLFHFNHPTTK